MKSLKPFSLKTEVGSKCAGASKAKGTREFQRHRATGAEVVLLDGTVKLEFHRLQILQALEQPRLPQVKHVLDRSLFIDVKPTILQLASRRNASQHGLLCVNLVAERAISKKQALTVGQVELVPL